MDISEIKLNRIFEKMDSKHKGRDLITFYNVNIFEEKYRLAIKDSVKSYKKVYFIQCHCNF